MRLQEGQRQQVLRVDIMGAVAGMGPHVELEERQCRAKGPDQFFGAGDKP